MMPRLDFIPSNLVTAYLTNCWGESEANFPVMTGGLYNVTVTNLTSGSTVSQTTWTDASPLLVRVDLLNLLYKSIHNILFEFSGFCAFAVVFGLSLAASLLSLHYLFKNWRNHTSHIAATGFTVLISASNIAVFALRVLAMARYVTNAVCPWEAEAPELLAFKIESLSSFIENPYNAAKAKSSLGLSLSLIPAFLWISDAFLLYRTWIIWVHHRKYTLIPALVFLASFIAGVFWLKQAVQDGGYNGVVWYTPISIASIRLFATISRWVPALAFSCGLDTIATGMIAGRLIYHHRKQRKLTEHHSTIYLPVVTIFVESAALSLISKILQLSVRPLSGNPVVVPLCTISSNLIVLRKALGADIGQMMAKGNQDLSALSFRIPDTRHSASASRIPGVFESHLIQTIGGRIIDFGPLGQAETLVPRKETQNEIEVQTAVVLARSLPSSRISFTGSLQREENAASDRG